MACMEIIPQWWYISGCFRSNDNDIRISMFFQSLLLLKSTEAFVPRALFVFHHIGFSLAPGVSICSVCFLSLQRFIWFYDFQIVSSQRGCYIITPPRGIINEQIWVKRNPSEVQVYLWWRDVHNRAYPWWFYDSPPKSFIVTRMASYS